MLNLNPDGGILVYTDGSAYTKDKTGGWAYVALDVDCNEASRSGFECPATIGMMELIAPTMALCDLYLEHGACEVLIMSDSEYVVRGFMDPTRARRKNKKWWDALDGHAGHHEYVEMEHTKGHVGNRWNEFVDKLASEARKSVRIAK